MSKTKRGQQKNQSDKRLYQEKMHNSSKMLYALSWGLVDGGEICTLRFNGPNYPVPVRVTTRAYLLGYVSIPYLLSS